MTEGEGRLVAGRYRLVRSLGRGGMGVVWQARDEYLQRDVAIKEIHLPGAYAARESDPAVRRALREARAAAGLRHPGIVTVHDVVTDDRRPWIVMELIEGGSLADVLRDEGPLPEHRTASIGLQVLRALDVAHRRGILHRDVKPGNIMLDQNRAVLTDFSIAAVDGGTALTGTDQLIGSPEYIAPERIDGQEATPAADLWALGVTLYSALAGRSPFQRTDTPATLAAIVAKDPDPLPYGRLWTVIEGLLRKSPAERLTADAAIAMLTETVELPTGPPAAPKPPPSAPSHTRIEDPSALDTVAAETMPSTRIAPPLLVPMSRIEEEPTVAPGETTAVPVTAPPPPKRTRRTGLIAAAVIAVVATVVVVIVWSSSGSSPPSGSGAGSTTPTAPASPQRFRLYTEALGFAISMPQEWTRHESEVSTVSDVVWRAQQSDPKVGPLTVQVQRDTSRPGTAARTYLADKDRAESANRENAGYHRIRLDDVPPPAGSQSAAELEYTHTSGNLRFHYQTRAFAGPRSVYVLTFSLYANDERTLQAQWQAIGPTLTTIRDSFRITAQG